MPPGDGGDTGLHRVEHGQLEAGDRQVVTPRDPAMADNAPIFRHMWGGGGAAGRCLSRGGRGSRGGGGVVQGGGEGVQGGGGELPRHPPAGLNHINQELQKCTTWTHSLYMCHNV